MQYFGDVLDSVFHFPYLHTSYENVNIAKIYFKMKNNILLYLKSTLKQAGIIFLLRSWI